MLKKRYISAKQLDGVVDLDRLQSDRTAAWESDPEKFFTLTYPAEELQRVVRGLDRRLTTGEGEGLVLAESVKGLGKSHALLLGYHLFKNPKEAATWAAPMGVRWSPPLDRRIVVHKFTDQSLPEDALWLLVARHLEVSWDSVRPPTRAQLRNALQNHHLVLILDELERGMDSIADPARHSQNMIFLQMLTEEAARNVQITVFAAIYDGNREPGATLKRLPRIELRFRKPEDRAAIVRHRLFLDADSYDRTAARTLIRSCVNVWKQFGVETSDAYQSRMESAFPFLPELMDLVFERISASGGFQGTRGALGLIGAMVDAAPEETSLFTASHCRLDDSACANRLQDLDPSAHLITCAAANLRDLAGQEHASAIASAVLMASLAPGGHAPGMSRQELIRHAFKPGDDPNTFHAALDAFARYGTYFHEREGRYLFDHEENEHAKVELMAAKDNDEAARAQVLQIWQQDLFKETRQSIVFTDLETSRQLLAGLPAQTQRYVLSPRRLSPIERHALYIGQHLRNGILLLEPKDPRVSHLASTDLLALGKRLRAAQSLAEAAQTAERRGRFEKIQREQSAHILRLLKSNGLVYVRIERWADSAEQAIFEEESLGSAFSREEVLSFLRAQIFPVSYIQEHLREQLRRSLPEVVNHSVGEIDRLYRNTLGFPVPLSTAAIPQAVTELVQDRSRIAGLQHSRGSFCGERVTLNEHDLNEAILSAPWPVDAAEPASGRPTPPLGLVSEPVIGASFPAASRFPATHDEWATPSYHSAAELRQELARRLDSIPSAVVSNVHFGIFARIAGQDLSALPAALRGSLKGIGDLELQWDLSLPGPLSKADLEDRCERLPTLSDGRYSARVKVQRPATAEAT